MLAVFRIWTLKYKARKWILSVFSSIKHMFYVRSRSALGEAFLLRTQNIIIIMSER